MSSSSSSSTASSSSHSHSVKHYKPKSGVHLHFTIFKDEYGAPKARCNLCPTGARKRPWETVATATRVNKHMAEKHILHLKDQPQQEEEPLATVQEPALSPEVSPSSSSQLPLLPTPSPSPSPSQGSNSGEPPAKKPVTTKNMAHFDRSFTPSEQLAAERAQALQLVMNAHSYHSQEQDWTRDFYRTLRSDYKPPSTYLLEKHVVNLNYSNNHGSTPE